jgi:glycosyltransferase involved in cell wall biosynthesis
MNPSISVFFPALNEEGSVERLTTDLLLILRSRFDTFEIIIVDDGSTDGTGEIADALEARHGGLVRVVHRERSSGYGNALKTGFAAARHDLVFYTDGDYQFDLNDLPRALDVSGDHDIVIGFREDRKDSRRRIFFSKGYNGLVRILFGLKFKDVDCSFKLFKRKALEAIPLCSDGYFIDTEILVRAKRQGLKIKEIGVRHLPRSQGSSKVSWKHVFVTLREIRRFRIRLRAESGKQRR